MNSKLFTLLSILFLVACSAENSTPAATLTPNAAATRASGLATLSASATRATTRPAPSPTVNKTRNVFFSDDFSQGLQERVWLKQCAQAYSCNLAQDGANVFFRSIWKPWDVRANTDQTKMRGGAEIVERRDGIQVELGKDNKVTKLGWDSTGQKYPTFNNDVWYGWRFRISDLSAIEARLANSVLIGEFQHPENLGAATSPPIAIGYTTGNTAGDWDELTLDLRLPCTAGTAGCKSDECDGASCVVAKPIRMLVSPNTRNQWRTVALHIFWAEDTRGYVEFFLDGQLLTVNNPSTLNAPMGTTRITGIRTLPVHAPNYLRLGQSVLRWQSNNANLPTTGKQIIVDYDNVVIGATAADVGL